MPDDVLADRLSEALEARIHTPVDVEGLLTGSQRRARQVRNRRIGLGTAGVALVIALPVAFQATRGSSDESGTAAVVSSDPPYPQVTSSSTGVPLPSPRSGLGPATSSTSTGIGDPSSAVSTQAPTPGPSASALPYTIPDSLAFSAADLPEGMHLLSAPEQSSLLPVVHGQVCREKAAADVVPVTGSQWTWIEGAGPAGASITLTITGWSTGGGGAAFDELVVNSGRCSFTTDQKVDSAGWPGYEGWMATSTIEGRKFNRAVVRIGDLIAGIEVRNPADGSSSVSVRALADNVVQQLTSSKFTPPT